jgi:hypothetical protein
MKFDEAKELYLNTTKQAREIDAEIIHILQTMFELEKSPELYPYELAVHRGTIQKKMARYNELVDVAMVVPRMIVMKTSFAQTMRHWNDWITRVRQERKEE